MIAVFYFLSAIAIWLGLLSLRGGIRFRRYVRRELRRSSADYAPFASVIAPFRGLDQGLEENFTALFRQQYPAYEVIFVADRANDPACQLVERLCDTLAEATRTSARLVISGPATDCGQKVHNLRVATAAALPSSQVLVFVDSDARPHDRWLQSLVAPLADHQVGAATGYRWFIVRSGLASHLRSAWNASIASALG